MTTETTTLAIRAQLGARSQKRRVVTRRGKSCSGCFQKNLQASKS